MDFYMRLALEIIRQSEKDYRGAIRYLKRHKVARTAKEREIMSNKRKMIDDCEKFFRSGWFYELAGCDGRILMNRIREEEGF